MDSLDTENDPSMQNVVEETVIEEQIDESMVVEEVVEEQMFIDDGTHLNVVEETTVNAADVIEEHVVGMEVDNENSLETEHMATGSTMFSAADVVVGEAVTEPDSVQPTETISEQVLTQPAESNTEDLVNINQGSYPLDSNQLINTEQIKENQVETVVSAADGTYVQENVIDQALLNAQTIDPNPQTSESKDMENFVNDLLSVPSEANSNLQSNQQSQLLGQDTLSSLNIINVDSAAQETPTIVTDVDHSQLMSNVADTQTLSSLTEPLLSTGLSSTSSGLDFVTQNSHNQAATTMSSIDDLTLPSMTTALAHGSVYENSAMDASKIFSSASMQLDENQANSNLQNDEDEAAKPDNFNLGVPGLAFSRTNVRVGDDGTKLVQIHQSQITPDQLETLQNNPNIKVVFRHIPSGKSFTKPPKNLFRGGSKRKYDSMSQDESIYNFDDEMNEIDTNSEYSTTKMNSPETKQARYNPNITNKKRGRIGRPRALPEAILSQNSHMVVGRRSMHPTRSMLQAALDKLNKPDHQFNLTLDTLNLTPDMLDKMDLNPKYHLQLIEKGPDEPDEEIEPEQVMYDPHHHRHMDGRRRGKKPRVFGTSDTQELFDVFHLTAESPYRAGGRKRKQPKIGLVNVRKLTRKYEHEGVEGVVFQPEPDPMMNLKYEEQPTNKKQKVKNPEEDESIVPRVFISLMDQEEIWKVTGCYPSNHKPQQEVPSIPMEPEPQEEKPAAAAVKQPAAKRGRPRKQQKLEEKEDSDDDDLVAKFFNSKQQREQKEKEAREKAEEEGTDDEGGEKGESAGEVIARKMGLTSDGDEKKKEDEAEEKKEEEKEPQPKIVDFEEDNDESLDNQTKLKNLLRQCSIDEITSIALPRALSNITLADFFFYKSGQICNEEVSFLSLYKQLESLHGSVNKESTRYNTLQRRAVKVAGDKRKEKVTLMPVYNKKAAESLGVNGCSVDSHVGFVQSQATWPMMVANSFKIPQTETNMKGKPLKHRINFPDLSEKSKQAAASKQANSIAMETFKPRQEMYNTASYPQSMYNTHKKWAYSSRNRNNPFRNKMLRSNLESQRKTTLNSNLDMNFQDQISEEKSNSTGMQNEYDQNNIQVAASNPSEVSDQQVASTAGNQVQQETSSASAGGESQGGAGGKQLVSIGDGQYFELPEGYTLIQTDEGYIIGQPGSTFVQGEDGNVYMTNQAGEEVQKL